MESLYAYKAFLLPWTTIRLLSYLTSPFQAFRQWGVKDRRSTKEKKLRVVTVKRTSAEESEALSPQCPRFFLRSQFFLRNAPHYMIVWDRLLSYFSSSLTHRIFSQQAIYRNRGLFSVDCCFFFFLLLIKKCVYHVEYVYIEMFVYNRVMLFIWQITQGHYCACPCNQL